MSPRRRPVRIGSVGSAMARFFHPRERISRKWPATDARHRITGASVRGEGMRRVGDRQQMCYLVTIPDIDDGTIFHIVKKNFKVDVEGEIITETNHPAPPRGIVIDDGARGRPNRGGGASLPSSSAPSSSTTASESLADFARDLIARTGGGIVVASTTPGDVEGLCGYLVAKYAVADIAVPARMSPPAAVDDAWHRLMLFPGVYDVACRRAYEMAANIVVVVGGGGADDEGDFAYDEFPGVVDHSPNAANDPPSAKEQRRRLAIWEMNRLGLSSSLSTAPRASVCTPPALSNNRAPLAGSGNNVGDDSVVTIRVKDQNGEETMFKVKTSTRFGKIMHTYAIRKGVEDSNLRFLLYGKAFGCMNGGRIVPTDTCAELGRVCFLVCHKRIIKKTKILHN